MLATTSPLRRALGYKKFTRPHKTILLLDSNYHLHAECRYALQALGHKVVTVAIGGESGAKRASDAMQQLLQALLGHRPDMVLTVNHIGFDAHNSIGTLLDDIEMPTAVWYVDSPFLLFDGFFLPAPKVSQLFVWDRAYVAMLEQHGAAAVTYLPLGCDPQKMAPAAVSPTRRAVFVGSSMAFAERKWRKRLAPQQRQAASRQAVDLLADRRTFIEAVKSAATPPDPAMTQLAYATWTATGTYRQKLLQALLDVPLEVFGDADWRSVMPAARRHPYVQYGAALARLYGESICCINATSLQMPSAVNQRVFDAPAAGSLVVTDAQPDVFELFAADELCVYRSAAELRDKVAFYNAHATARRQLIERARQRVLAEHTYVRRLATLMQIMQRRFGPPEHPARPTRQQPATAAPRA